MMGVARRGRAYRRERGPGVIIADSQSGIPADGVVGLIVGGILYFIPSIVALARRGEANTGGVVVLNLFAGWTIIGWIIALVMACRTNVRQPVYMVPPPGWSPPPAPPQGPPPPPDAVGYR